MPDIAALKKIGVITLACYAAVAILFYCVAGSQMSFSDSRTDMLSATAPTGEILAGTALTQPFTAQGDQLLGVTLYLSTYQRQNTSQLVVSVDTEGVRLSQMTIDTSTVLDNAMYEVIFPQPVSLKQGAAVQLVLESPDAAAGNAVTAWYGSTMSAARGEVPIAIPAEEHLSIGESPIDGGLCIQYHYRDLHWFGQYYWHLALSIGVLIMLYWVYLLRQVRNGRRFVGDKLFSVFQRYHFLIAQLVARDFKTKYKRSLLGVLWSFLNPLLTMLVQYIVFSTIFKSDIPNFALYLLTGIVCFNFFSEATTMSLQSITGNANLITKVYVPKYVYPVSRVLSSTINLLLSLIPLIFVMLFTGVPLRPAVLLLPFGLLCLLSLCMGMAFILSTLMVFFRDMQFLWGVISMLWMYATPIFYPESILPASFITVFKLNPLYHIIRFIRIILMDGVSPEPKAYVLCILASVIPLVVGVIIFKKNQNKFVLNL